MTSNAALFASNRAATLWRKVMPEQRLLNIKDLGIPIATVVVLLGGALAVQSRLLSVEHEIGRVQETLLRIENTQGERLRAFAATLAALNPTLKVPEVR